MVFALTLAESTTTADREAAFLSVDNGINDTMLAAINDAAERPACYFSHEKRIRWQWRDTVNIA